MSRRARQALRLVVLGLGLVSMLLLAGCVGPKVPSTTPDMQGAHVTDKSGADDAWTFRMDVDVDAAKQAGIPNAGAGYDVASVRVDSRTTIVRRTADGLEAATAQDVIAASFVNVWFTGAVAESYPVQATAGTIEILQ